MKRNALLCIAGGGTGGHVMPALALADAARDRWPELRVQFIGAERGLEARLLPERGENALLLRMHAVQGAGLTQRLRVLLWELPRAILRIRRSWRDQRPDLLVGVGGYASVSGVLAALLCRIPVVLYEQNAMPGLVNRTLARFCDAIMLGFEAARSRLPGRIRSIVTGNIVRRDIRRVSWQTHQPPRLLVMGGSQGAAVLNSQVPEACALLARKGRRFFVSHIAGRDETARSRAESVYRQAGIEARVLGFCDAMPEFYADGELLIARAGAMTVSEAAAIGLPSILVPLPHAADDHQRANAESLGDGAIIIDQSRLTPMLLAATIEELLFDPERLEAMHRRLKERAIEDAAERQIGVLSDYLEEAVA